MIQLPDSSRFHVIDAGKVQPRFGRLAARPIYVYLPELAEQDHRRRFPVLYCHDGQNIWDDPHACFGHGGWYLNQIVDQLVREGKIEPVILVGIPNSDSRFREYTPGKTYDDIFEHPYANFVCDVVKRYVDRKFPTKKDRRHTALLGSSLGGLISVWMAHKLHETFSKAACLSGAFQFRDRQGKLFTDFLLQRDHQDLKIYLDTGTIKDGAALTRKVRDAYLARGWEVGKDLQYFEDKGGEHNERCWRDRVWRALVFLFDTTGRNAR
jgi:enterochelin esterase-like enzyme